MNENIGGNVADLTSEVEMVEKLQNQEFYLTIRPEHHDEHHESRETISFLKEPISLSVQNIKMNIMKAEKLLHF